MPLEEWMKFWMYMQLGCLMILPRPAGTARPRFDTSTDMGLVLVPADAEIDSVIFRLRATDQDADFPLVFDITATVTPIVRIENLPCTLYNKVCQANVILTKRLVPGRLHDFAVRVKDSKGDSNSMQATISVTNATTQRDKIFPHIPAIIMVPEDTKPGKELDYVLVRSNQWSGKPVYIELWQPKELFTIRQRQTPAETRGVITLIGELDFETQSMYTLKMYATDPYNEPKKDTRNIAGLHLVVIVQDVQDVPPIFTLAPPLTKINNTIQPGDFILRVHAEDGDKGVPREVTYGLVSEGNPFTPFFNISETTGEIILARPLEELTLITHVGAPVVLSVVAEEIRRSTSEPPAQATVVKVGLLLGEPGNSPPFFENDNYVAWMDENAEPGTMVNFTEHYITKVRDEDIGKAGVFALKLNNNNGTFEINPAVAERVANFIITVRDNSLIDYEKHKSLRFEIIAQEVGPATNLSANVPCTIFLRDVNDNAPEFDSPAYRVTLSEDVPAGTRVVQVHATDKDTGSFGRIQYTRILGPGNEAFLIDPNTGIITVAMGDMSLDREKTATLELSIEGRDEDGKGLRGTVPLIINLLDVNDNAPIFEKEAYEFDLNEDLTNFTMPALIKALDGDAEPPNNEVRYEIIHGNYENKFHLDELTGELFLREPINKARRTRHNSYQNFATKVRNDFSNVRTAFEKIAPPPELVPEVNTSSVSSINDTKKIVNFTSNTEATPTRRKKRENDDILFTLTARAYDLGVPHMSGVTRVNVMRGPIAGARVVSFVVPGENPDPEKTAKTLAAITGGRVSVQEIRPYTIKDVPTGAEAEVPSLEGGKKSIVVARVEPNKGGAALVDIDRIRAALAANGVGVIGGDMTGMGTKDDPKSNDGTTTNHNTNTVTNITTVHNEEVTVYRAENRLLFWLLIILGLLMLGALIALIICCICPGCPFYMAPRKRRVHSSETLIPRSDARPKRHLHRKHTRLFEGSWPERKQAWSADPMRRNWQFNRRNQKAGGLASLPGDVNAIDREQEILEKAASVHLRDGPMLYSSMNGRRRPEDERIYIEDVEGIRARGYMGMDSFRHHDPERGLEIPQQVYINQEPEHIQVQPKFMREQHFYRDGNAEVLRLVTRGQIEEGMLGKRPQTLVIEQRQLGAYRNDGKEILLQRFIEDQTNRHATDGQDLHDSFQDIERRSMESHQRQKEAIFAQAPQQHQQQSKIVLLPERLEEDHRQHFEELGPEVQRLIIDHASFEKNAFEQNNNQELAQGPSSTVNAPVSEVPSEKREEQTPKPSIDHQNYLLRDLELARQNALLTKLLLDRDNRDVGGGALVDSASYLETQSLPGQVAIATQTDRTAATQTEMPNRSRSDNDESEEEARIRKKLKSKKRYAEPEPRRIRTLWIKSPIEEEEMQYGSEKKTIFLRKKSREVKDGRRTCLEPDVLREISDSLDENVESPITARRREKRDFTSEKTRLEDESEKLQESSSMELEARTSEETILEKKQAKVAADDSARKSHRGLRENIVEPSFRILEKEMNSLSKKLSRLTGKKMLQYSNGSETDSHDQVKPRASTTSGKKVDKKVEIDETKKAIQGADALKKKRSKSKQRTIISETPSTVERIEVYEERIEGKTQHAPKSRKSQNISTGSSDFEETMEKHKKPVPPVAKIEKQRPMPAKSSYSKLKRHSRVEPKDLAKPNLGTLSQETGEGRDTSDTGSKSSSKSYKNERNSMRIKSSGKVEGQSGVASSSASSDSTKDKRGYKKEKSVLDKTSVVELRDAKSEMELSTGSPSSENTKDEKLRVKDKSKLHKKDAANIVDSKSESEQSVKSPYPDNVKQTISLIKQKPMLDRKNAVEADEEKVEIEKTRDSLILQTVEDQEFQAKENLRPDGKDVEAIDEKTSSPGRVDDSRPETSKDIPEQKKETITPDRETVADRSAVESKSESSAAGKTDDEPKAGIPDEEKDETLSIQRDVESTAAGSEFHDQNTVKTPEQKTEIQVFHDGSFSAVSQNGLVQKSETLEEISVADSGSSDKALQEKILMEFSDESTEKIRHEETEIEVEGTSPEERKLGLLVDPAMAEVRTSGSLIDEHEETSGRMMMERKSDELDQEPRETESSIEGMRIPEQEIADFISREARDSAESLQSQYQSITEEAEKIVDIVLGSVMMKNMDEKKSDAGDKEPKVERVEEQSVNNMQTAHEEDSKETTGAGSELERQQSEDGGAFSDNFESFCGTDGLSKDSLPARGSDDEIPYEILRSGPSEEQVSSVDAMNVKDGINSSEQEKSVGGHEEKEATERTETHDPPETNSLKPVADQSTHGSPTIIVSRSSTPVSLELEKQTTIDAAADSTDESDGKLTKIEPTEGTESPKSPKTEEIGAQTVKEHKHRVPIVPPLEIELLNEAIRPAVESDEEIDRNKSPSFSLKSPEKLPPEIPSQKEFGIADALFVDAKIVTVSSSPKENENKSRSEVSTEGTKQEVGIPVPPINLEELSRAMLEDADDSDTSEASSKTMLTARPYGTPRHRPVSGAEPMEAVDMAAGQEAAKMTESKPGSEFVDGKKLPEEQTDQMALRGQSPEPFVSDPTEKITEEENAVEIESNSEVSQSEVTSGGSAKKPESDEPIGGLTIETTGQQEEAKIETTEKVQLSQIEQTNLSPDPDGFASLPETGIPVKSLADTTLLDETTLSESMKEFPKEFTKQSPRTEDKKKCEADGLSSSKTFIASTPMSESKPVTEDADRSEKSLSPDKSLISRKPREIPMRMPIDKQSLSLSDKRAKLESPAQREKKNTKKAAASSEDLSKASKKRMTPTTRTGSLKKERPVTTLKDESDKLVKRTTVVGQLGRSRDAKPRAKPVGEIAADQSNWLSKPDRMRRTWKKTEHPDKGAVQKVATKTKSERPEIGSTQQKVRGLRMMKVQERDKKVKPTKILPEYKVEESIAIEKMNEPAILKEGTEVEKSVSPGKKPIETHKTIQPERPRARTAILEIQKLTKDDIKKEEAKQLEISTRSAKSPERWEDVKLETADSKEQPTEANTLEEISKDSEKKDSGMSDEQGSTVVRGPDETIQTSAAVETMGSIGENLIGADQEKETENLQRQAEKTKALTQGTDKSEASQSVEESKIPGTPETTEFQKEIRTDAGIKDSLLVETNDSESEDSIQPKVLQTVKPTEGTPQEVGKSPKKRETDPETKKPTSELAIDAVPGDGIPSPQKTEKPKKHVARDPEMKKPDNEEEASVEEKLAKTEISPKKISGPRESGKLEREPDTEAQPKAKEAQSQEAIRDKTEDSLTAKAPRATVTMDKTPSPRKASKPRRETETTVIESQSRYMEWYKSTREEMERKRHDRKDGEEEEVRPKWLRKRTRQRWIKVGPEDKRIFDPQLSEMTPSRRKKIKPLINVESEQLKAIVRQGRMLRKARGEGAEEPQIQIFAPDKPPPPPLSIDSRAHHHHHLIQHSEYKYEKMPLPPFYLHPQPPPDIASQILPQGFDVLCPEDKYSSLPTVSRCPTEMYDSGVAHQPLQGGNKLRHGELLEKKSVFDIAYSEAAPSQLRSDSTTPPS